VNTVLCICTYKRPDGIARLLESLKSLHEADGLKIIVVDNHGDGEGAAVCHSLPSDYPFEVSAFIQTSPGISHARNKAVSEALKLNPELLAFLDDDERPSEKWLAELHRVQKETNADVVGGPTLSEFPEGVDEETRNNPYFGADLGQADASACQLQAAGNFMIKASVVETMAPEFFHPAFAQSGGEDLAFFTQLAKAGATMFWASHAVVHEAVPANRLSPEWMKTRVINIANSRVRVMQMLEPGIKASLIRGLKTVVLGDWAAINSLYGLIVPKHREKARLLRWKFWGKLTAHLRIATTRGEGH